MSTHYILMSGSTGCLPDSCEVYESEQDAIDSAGSMFDLTGSQTMYLHIANGGIVSLDSEQGADYVSITVCTCDNPSIHSDSAE